MDKKLLNKFIANQCTSDEIDAFFGWVQNQSKTSSGETLFKSYWDTVEITDANTNDDFVRQRLDKIHHTINLNKSERLEGEKIRFFPGKKVSLVRLISRAAAILLIPVLTILIYTSIFQPELYSILNVPHEYEIVSPSGSRIHLELSDGTKVWLNHNSKMVYPQRFIGKTRTVQLIGEGYFEIAQDKKKPFIVESRRMAVKAVGTAFNVKAYPDDVDFETTLELGKVIILENTPGRKSEICMMKPGEHFAFSGATNKYSLKAEDPTRYVSWKEGKLVFKDDLLGEVAEKLSRWYNVKVTLEDPGLNSLTYTATFVDETLYQVLEMLEIVTPITYTVSERRKLPDGSFSEKEILIFKKEKEGKTN